MLIKSLLLFVLTTSFGFVGLLGISANFLHSDFIKISKIQNSKQEFNSEKNSSDFEQISDEIKNSAINYSEIEEKINSVDDKIQKSYLLASLKFRQQKYIESYDMLIENLKNIPAFADYYILLVNNANILDKIDEVKKQVNENLKSNSDVYNFISGLIEYHSQNINKAIGFFEKGSSFKENIYWLANSYRLKGNYKKAVEVLQNLKSSLKTDDDYLSSVEISIGTNFYLSGNYEEAEKHYNVALSISEKTGDTINEIKSKGNIAILRDLYGEVEEARTLLKSSIKKAKQIENQELLGFLYSEIGVSYSYTGELIDARQNYSESFDIYKKLNTEERLAYLSGNIAAIYSQQSNYNEALKYYNYGINYSGENIYGKIINLTGIADVYVNLSNYSKALEVYKVANQLADSINSIPAKFKVKEGIGSLFYNVNKPGKAIQFFNEADKLIVPDEYPYETAGLYNKLGVAYTEVKNYDEAKKYILKGIEISENSGDVYTSLILKTELANLYTQTGNLNSAEEILNELLPVSVENSLFQLEAVQSLYLAKIKNQNHTENNAIKLLEKSFDLSGSVNDFNTQIESGSLIAEYYIQKKDDANAEYWFNKIASIVDKISPALVSNNQLQISHFSGVEKIFEKMISFYLSGGRAEDAFNLLERYRSRNTVQNLVNLKLMNAVDSKDLVDEFIDTRWQINSGIYDGSEKQKLTKKLDSLTTLIAGENSNLNQILSSTPWMDYNSIKEKLSDNENLISIFTTNEFTEIFLATNKNLKSFHIQVSGDSLVNLMKQIAPVYQTYPINKEVFVNQDLFSFDAQSAYNFYEALLSKVITQVPEGEDIIFSLPKELLSLPMEFLVTSWSEGESPYYYNDKEFLIKRNPVSYTPSVSVYLNQKNKEENKGLSNLLVGDPKFSDEKFRMSYRGGMLEDQNFSLRNLDLFPLEYSQDEIENINEIIDNNVILLANHATETNLKTEAPESNVIHISSHSFLYNSQPLILFSQEDDEKNNGFLELGEIVQMNLKSNLVVLSSCRSGLGEVEDAEGTLGMQKAFFDAGAASVVVSLWDVNDKYTSYFMKDFYENLSAGLDKTESLRKTKIDFINKYSANPYYWSAFILSGNISNITLEKPGNFSLSYLISFLILLGILLSGFLLFRNNKSAR